MECRLRELFTEPPGSIFDDVAQGDDGDGGSTTQRHESSPTPTLGIDFVRASQPHLGVPLRHCAGGVLRVAQDLQVGLGGVVWDCGIALAQFIDTHPELVRGRRVLELGCGTGLCAALFRSAAARLVGVDVSARMLERARARGLYDELLLGDAVQVTAERVLGS